MVLRDGGPPPVPSLYRLVGCTRTCHWQYGWFDVSYCEIWGGGGTPPGGGGDPGGDLTPPPSVTILRVSDENPGQPVMVVQMNDAVVDCTVSYNGYSDNTVGKTDSIFLQPLNNYGYYRGSTPVTIQCRNASNVYATDIMNVSREFKSKQVSDTVHAILHCQASGIRRTSSSTTRTIPER